MKQGASCLLEHDDEKKKKVGKSHPHSLQTHIQTETRTYPLAEGYLLSIFKYSS